MVAPGRRLPGLSAQLRRRERRRPRRPPGGHLARAVPRGTRGRRGVAEPVLPLGARRRRLRRRRLPRRRPAPRHARRLRRDARRRCTPPASGSSSTSCRTTRPICTSGSRRRSPPARVRQRASATSSARAADPTVRPRRPTGSRRSAAPRGSASPTASGTCTTSPIEQPDLNWENPEVREDFVRTLRFWSDRGVDGFRIDVAHMLTKDLTEPLPSQAELDALPRDGLHPTHRPRRRARRLRRVARGVQRVRPAAHGRRRGVGRPLAHPAVRERREPRPGVQLRPARGGLRRRPVPAHRDRQPRAGRGIRIVDHVGAVQPRRRPACHALRAAAPRTRRRRAAHAQARQRVAAVGRHASRSSTVRGDSGARGPRPSSCSALPGSAYLYQGEELGLHEVAEIDDVDRQDPTFFRSPGIDMGRDGCRVPLPWTTHRRSFGFGGVTAHLPQPSWFGDVSVEAQERRPALHADAVPARARAAARAADRPSSWNGSTPGAPTCCGSCGRTGGRSSRTSVRRTTNSPPPTWTATSGVVLSSTEVPFGIVPGECTIWLQPA